jgi:hypothetical protein
MDQATNTLSANRLVRYIGIDRLGVTRVWGQAETSDGAWEQCYLRLCHRSRDANNASLVPTNGPANWQIGEASVPKFTRTCCGIPRGISLQMMDKIPGAWLITLVTEIFNQRHDTRH